MAKRQDGYDGSSPLSGGSKDNSGGTGGAGGGAGGGGGGGGGGGFRGRKVTTCSFCGKTSRDVGPMVEGPNDVYICSNCTDLCQNIFELDEAGMEKRRLLSLVGPDRLRRVLRYMLDEAEFLSPYGIRSLSKFHESQPVRLDFEGQVNEIGYRPGESDSGLFGGNSNWRGPIWFPINYLLIEALRGFHRYYGDDFQVECPTGSGQELSLDGVADELTRRLAGIFTSDATGARPVNAGSHRFANDPFWKEHLLFYEYFHGETGAGLGASHQTGWTGLVGILIQLFGMVSAEQFLKEGLRPPRKV